MPIRSRRASFSSRASPTSTRQRSSSAATRSTSPGTDLVDMIKEDLVAERVAISSYGEIVRWLGDGDITTRRLMESILAVEEEHADDLLTFLKQFGVDL